MNRELRDSLSVTLRVNGQSFPINGLTDQEVQALQTNQAVGKTYTIHVTQNPDGSYNISSGTDPLQQ